MLAAIKQSSTAGNVSQFMRHNNKTQRLERKTLIYTYYGGLLSEVVRMFVTATGLVLMREGPPTVTRNFPKATTNVPSNSPTHRHYATSTFSNSNSFAALLDLFTDPSIASRFGLHFADA